MARYFIEVAYKGSKYSGFQVQENSDTIQGRVESAILILCKEKMELTGSSRTDAGVHALQNFFHVDTDLPFAQQHIYKLNALLPNDIAIKGIYQVASTAHARFDALGRAYEYRIYQQKNPFLVDVAYFMPYPINRQLLNEAAEIVLQQRDFTSFCKKNAQVFTYECTIHQSVWQQKEDYITFNIQGNRFLRGMVRGLVATMLRVGKGQLSIQDFQAIFSAKNCNKAFFDAPGQGLFLQQVIYPQGHMLAV